MKKQILLIMPFLLGLTNSKCAFSVFCPDPKDLATCYPTLLDQADKDPQIYNYTDPFVCQEYAGQEACCNDFQNKQMLSSFRQIDATFGADGGGCDFCGANMKRFWCAYTCSPNQDSFVIVGDQNISVVDPTDPQRRLEVMNVTLTVESETSCSIYDSCQLAPYVTQVTAMGSPAGFLSFQGANAVVNGKQFMTIQYNNMKNQSLMIPDFNQCNLPYPESGFDAFGFPIKERCLCNCCATSCESVDFQPLSPLEGFDFTLVIVIYSMLILITGFSVYVRRRSQKIKIVESSKKAANKNKKPQQNLLITEEQTEIEEQDN